MYEPWATIAMIGSVILSTYWKELAHSSRALGLILDSLRSDESFVRDYNGSRIGVFFDQEADGCITV